ncbi:MAG: hypothetical protein AAF348_09385 [Bacteroidota bacterium]
MKRIILPLALMASMIFTGCSSDDDGGDSRSCELLGLIPITITDNGDGTARLQVEGESAFNADLGDQTFEEYADDICSGDIDLDLDFTQESN